MALIKLRDSDRPRDATAKALLDGDVYDRDGQKIGSVKDLYVGTEEGDVRFLDVGAGGFMGLGEKHFMIPMEAVTDTSGGGVTIEQSREKVERSPVLDTKGVPEDAYL
jgi:sporulation protein YlmC with PRC-barrel domain